VAARERRRVDDRVAEVSAWGALPSQGITRWSKPTCRYGFASGLGFGLGHHTLVASRRPTCRYGVRATLVTVLPSTSRRPSAAVAARGWQRERCRGHCPCRWRRSMGGTSCRRDASCARGPTAARACRLASSHSSGLCEPARGQRTGGASVSSVACAAQNRWRLMLGARRVRPSHITV
jgi:hypothetical protein